MLTALQDPDISRLCKAWGGGLIELVIVAIVELYDPGRRKLFGHNLWNNNCTVSC